MTNNNSYQPGPEDLELARYLDRERDTTAGSTERDPLLPYLKQYKTEAGLRIQDKPNPDLYLFLQNEIEPAAKRGRSVLQLHPAFWRVAAVFLVAALIALIYLFTDIQRPDLMAESHAAAVDLTLTDGSNVTLRPNSRLYKLEESEFEQRYKIEGEAYFEVEQVSGRGFFVMTDYSLAEVTGTSFMISSWGGRGRVYLETGSLIFSLPDGSEPVELSPGQFSSTLNGMVGTPAAEDRDAYLGWLRNELVMDSRQLGDITDEIAHHFNITVIVPVQLRDEELSGTLLLDDPEQILRDIAISTGLNLDRVDDRQYRLSEN